MAGETKTTTDHNIIRKWAEERGGKPAVVIGIEARGQGIGLLRIYFPGFAGEETLQEISWDEFFKTFEEKKLEFLYQEDTREGEQSRFCKFVAR